MSGKTFKVPEERRGHHRWRRKESLQGVLTAKSGEGKRGQKKTRESGQKKEKRVLCIRGGKRVCADAGGKGGSTGGERRYLFIKVLARGREEAKNSRRQWGENPGGWNEPSQTSKNDRKEGGERNS